MWFFFCANLERTDKKFWILQYPLKKLPSPILQVYPTVYYGQVCNSSLLLCSLQIKHKAPESCWHLLPVSLGGRSCGSIYFSVIKIDTRSNRFDQCRNRDSIMLTFHSYFTFTGYSESIDMGARSQDSTCLKHHTRLFCMDQSEKLKSKSAAYIIHAYMFYTAM